MADQRQNDQTEGTKLQFLEVSKYMGGGHCPLDNKEEEMIKGLLS